MNIELEPGTETPDLTGVPPDISAAVDDADKDKEDYPEFNKAVEAMDKLLSEIESGKYAKAADLEAISTDLAAIKSGMQEAYDKHQADIDERIAAAVSKGNEDLKASVRDTVADLLKGRGNAQDQAQAQKPGLDWQVVKANEREQGHYPKGGFPVKGVDTVVLYADVRPPQRGGQVQAAWPGSFDSTSGTGIGSGVTPIAPWIFLQEMDPFQAYANVIYPAYPSFTLPSLPKSLTVNKNRAQNPTTPDAVTINPGTHSADFWEKVMTYPQILEDDVEMIRQMVSQNIYLALAFAWGADVAGTMKAGKASMQKVPTGVAAALPTTANFPARIAQMLKAVKSFYRMGAVWMMNEAVEAVWNAQWSAAGGIDPESARGTLLGFPKVLNSHLDDGGTAADISAYFGNFRMALTEAIYKEIEMRYYVETTPGDLTFYACMRAKSALQNTEGVSYLSTGTT